MFLISNITSGITYTATHGQVSGIVVTP